jgi:hypothetical protein
MLSARQWQSASCEIISSRVHTSQSSDASMHRVDVTYRYFVDDLGYLGRDGRDRRARRVDRARSALPR